MSEHFILNPKLSSCDWESRETVHSGHSSLLTALVWKNNHSPPASWQSMSHVAPKMRRSLCDGRALENLEEETSGAGGQWGEAGPWVKHSPGIRCAGKHFRVSFLVFKTKMSHWVVNCIQLSSSGWWLYPLCRALWCRKRRKYRKNSVPILTYPNRLLWGQIFSLCACMCAHTLISSWYNTQTLESDGLGSTVQLINSMSCFSYFVFLTLYFLFLLKLY